MLLIGGVGGQLVRTDEENLVWPDAVVDAVPKKKCRIRWSHSAKDSIRGYAGRSCERARSSDARMKRGLGR